MNKSKVKDLIDNPNGNTCLSLLTQDERDLLYDEMENFYIVMNYKFLNNKNFSFGLENEFEINQNLINLINRKLREYGLDDVWFLKQEVSIRKCNKIVGEELATPILFNNPKYWKSLEIAWNIISRYARNTKTYGQHLHIDGRLIGDSLKGWQRFLLLCITYEQILFRFGYGEYLTERERTLAYSAPLSTYSTKEWFKEYDNLTTFLDVITADIPIKETSVNVDYLSNTLFYNGTLSQLTVLNTIEFRNFANTNIPAISQNYVAFIVRMMLYALSPNFDEKRVTERHKKMSSILSLNPQIKVEKYYRQVDIDMAFELADMIFPNNLEKINFLKQYCKDRVNTREFAVGTRYSQPIKKSFVKRR